MCMYPLPTPPAEHMLTMLTSTSSIFNIPTPPPTAPVVEKPLEEPPPYVVLVQGPPGVGKSLLIKCLVKHFTRQTIVDMRGPVTVVAGKARRVTFIECPQVCTRFLVCVCGRGLCVGACVLDGWCVTH